MAKVKVFADKQTNRQTNGQTKNYMPPNLRLQGHKNSLNNMLIHVPRLFLNFFDYKFRETHFLCLHVVVKGKDKSLVS